MKPYFKSSKKIERMFYLNILTSFSIHSKTCIDNIKLYGIDNHKRKHHFYKNYKDNNVSGFDFLHLMHVN